MFKPDECLDIIGWQEAPMVLPTDDDQLVSARGGEELNVWRHSLDLIELCEAASAELGDLLAAGGAERGNWRSHASLARQLLADDPEGIIAALAAALRAGATAADLGRALAYAAALRVAWFGTANKHSDWETAHHAFTYCNALHQLLKRITAEPSGGTGEPRAVAWRDPRGDAPLSDPLSERAARATAGRSR
jgi:hypothetical protein